MSVEGYIGVYKCIHGYIVVDKGVHGYKGYMKYLPR